MNKSRNATAPSGFIQIENNEKLIVSTNYWTSRDSQNGIYYFSVNAGCVRLLLPNKDTSGEKLDDTVLNATQYVIISRGTYRGGMDTKSFSRTARRSRLWSSLGRTSGTVDSNQ